MCVCVGSSRLDRLAFHHVMTRRNRHPGIILERKVVSPRVTYADCQHRTRARLENLIFNQREKKLRKKK